MTRTVYTYGSRAKLGWEPDPDPLDKNFPMELAFGGVELDAPLSPAWLYKTGPILNQGKYPKCVGYSSRQWLTTGTIENTSTEPTAEQIYCEARNRDPWEGDCKSGPSTGTSIRAAFKYLQEKGLVASYLWAWNAESVRRWILSGNGPVVVGTPWYRSMNKPIAGRLIVNTRTDLVGGHAFLLSGYRDDTRMFRVTNSWGTIWGQQGHAWLRYADLDVLFQNRGEACTATEILYTPLAVAKKTTRKPKNDIQELLEQPEDYVKTEESNGTKRREESPDVY